MGTGIKGFKSQKMLKSRLNGYTENESIDVERYVTIQELPGDRYAADVLIHGAYKVNLLGVLTAAAGSNIRVIKCVGHGAEKGDFVKFITSAIEVQVLSVPDADTMVLATELPSSPVGLTFDIIRGVTPSYNKDGSLNVSIASNQGPVQYRDANTGSPQEVVFDPTDDTKNRPLPSMTAFKQDGNYIPVVEDTADVTKNVPLPSGAFFQKDGNSVPVIEDTAVAANNNPMPGAMFIKKDDGNFYPVTLDTTNPYNHTPIPVAITDVAGTANVNITAGDLNVSIKHNGVDPSSVRIGDGTNIATVNSSNELKVIDTDTHTKLDTIHTDLTNINTRLGDQTQYTRISDGTNVASVTVATELKVSDADTHTKLDTLHTDVGLLATSANQTNGNQITQIKSGSNGNILDVITLASNPVGGDKGLVAHAIMHGKDGGSFNDVKVNAAGEMSVTAVNFPTTVDTNTGAATANTLRSVLATRHEAAATPLSLRESDGTNFLSSIALAAAQLTSGALTAIKMGASVIMGWDGTTHRELAVTTGGAIRTSSVVKSGTITSAQKTVGSVGTTGAVRATVSGSAPATTRTKLWVKPSKNNTGAIYIGSASVTISTGMEIIGPDRWEILDDSNDWYLISDTDGQTVEIIEVA